MMCMGIALSLANCAHVDGTKAQYNIQSANYLNPDINGNAAPLVLSIYQLKNPGNFSQLDFNQITNNAGDVLNNILVDMESIVIPPNYHHVINQRISTSAHYIGITAAYRNIDSASWRKVIRIPDNAKKVTLEIHLESQNLIIDNQT